MPHKAKFRPIQLKDGSAWYVLYTPDKGPTEHLEGFYTEEDALEWIKFESTSWLAKKKRRRQEPRLATPPARRQVAQTFMRTRTPVRRAPHVYGRYLARARRSQECAFSFTCTSPAQRIS